MITRIPFFDEPKSYRNNNFVNERMVRLESGGRIVIEMQYPILNMEHAVDICYLREEAASRLFKAADLLPDGLSLKVWDGWRPFLLQKELYEKYKKELIEAFNLKPDNEETARVIRGFVSEPVDDRDHPPVHTTGGAVDVTLIDKDGRNINMGTAFDAFSKETRIDYFEDTDENEIKCNRRLLYDVMTRAGFTNLPSEWWHYDFGDRFWGYYTKEKSKYRGIWGEEEICEE